MQHGTRQRGLWDEIVVDSFAGGGGASLGIEAALGRPVDLAINHDRDAIAMHEENHPSTRHYHENVWAVDPIMSTAGRPVGLAWFSPDCCHFSRAKGTKPVKKEIRGLAWVVIRWARAVRPRVICLENVEEWLSWGPLVDGRPCPNRKGHTFRRWLAQLHKLGYAVEWRVLRACDYGAPTTRKRLFLIARCDGRAIVWPEVTHGKGTGQPWRSAAECIQWELPCPSIFERKKPLAEKTEARIAEGTRRFVLNHPDPFIVPGPAALSLIQRSWGERPGQRPRALDIQQPLGTVVAGGIKHALVTAWLAKHFGGVYGNDLRRPVSTVTAKDHHSLVTSELLPPGSSYRTPEVRAFLAKYNREAPGRDLRAPIPTVTTRDRFGLVKVAGHDYEISDIGMRMLSARELYRAQGFPDSYVIDQAGGRRLTKTAQIRMAGNSVCPPIVQSIVTSNFIQSAAVWHAAAKGA